MSIKASVIVLVSAGLLFAVEPVKTPPTAAELQKKLNTANAYIKFMEATIKLYQLKDASHAAVDRSRQVEQLLVEKYEASYKENAKALQDAVKKAEDAEKEK